MSQIGFVPEQSVFVKQLTQTFFVVSHTGVGALQSVEATHCTQVPALDRQAGVAGFTDAHSDVPLAHARQVFVAGSQTGFGAMPHSESVVHSTHAPEGAQTGAPASASPQSPALAHPRHFFVVESQTGVTPLHEAAVQFIPAAPPLPEWPPTPALPPAPAPPSTHAPVVQTHIQEWPWPLSHFIPLEQSASPLQKPVLSFVGPQAAAPSAMIRINFTRRRTFKTSQRWRCCPDQRPRWCHGW